MRVLILSWEYPPHVVGGLGVHVAELVPELARLGVEVHLVTPRRQGGRAQEVFEGLFVHRIDSPTGLFDRFVDEAHAVNRALEGACRELIPRYGPFHLIHNHDWLTAEASRRLKHAYRLPLVATIHATERGRGRGHLAGDEPAEVHDAEWWLTYDAWRVICCTQYMKAEMQAYFDTPADKIDVIPNGVDPAPFQAYEGVDLSAFRAAYAAPDERLVLHVGRIVAEKGIEILIRSVPLVLKSFPRARFVIAGKGPEWERMLALVEELGLSEHVYMPGFISDDDRNRLYVVADCAVFPTLYEPFGIVALEAMAARTPVVVSEVGGLREVVRHAETGITIYPNSPESCAWGIVHTLQHPEWARQRVENAYHEVLTVYNWASIAQQTLEVYDRVVEERKHTAW
jgi:glycogen(starch) synthase